VLAPGEALSEILGRLAPLGGTEHVAIGAAVGRVLARAQSSDVDLPPFEKSAMDGFAVHAADFEGRAERSLPILGESRAGEPMGAEVPRGACAAIYTGAELPRGCDAVVIVERSERLPDGRVLLRDRPHPGQHVCHRGQDLRLGDTVLPAGRRLRAADLSVLASVGADPVPVAPRPRVAIWTSGNELVEPSARPGPGQIREGNTLHLAALSRAAGASVIEQGIVRDDPERLAERFEHALEGCDALVTTGGVSMGDYDFVGRALERAGVEPVFHRVAIKPGKPLWFGMRGAVPVFALPGNPVSCLVNHAVFVRPALELLGGELPAPRRTGRGRWAGSETAPNDREQHVPAAIEVGDDAVVRLVPVRWNGSADVVGLSRAEALAVVPIGAALREGDPVDFRRLD
jgi:molybdopterin molybdotransferase